MLSGKARFRVVLEADAWRATRAACSPACHVRYFVRPGVGPFPEVAAAGGAGVAPSSSPPRATSCAASTV